MLSVKSRNNGLKIGILSLVGLVVLALIVVFFTRPKEPDAAYKIDINDYVTGTFELYNGYGSASIDVDYDKMVDDATIRSAITEEAKLEAKRILNESDAIKLTFEMSDTLSNGDEIPYSWTINEALIKNVEKLIQTTIISENGSCVVYGLYDIEEIDPFENLQIKTNQTSSGAGTIDFSVLIMVNGPDITWKVSHDGENGKIKNGDTLHLKIDEKIDVDQFAKTFGLKIKRFEAEHTVDYLCDFARDELIFDHIGKDNKSAMNKVIEDWVVSGLNDENQAFGERQYEAVGYMFYTNNDPKEISIEETQDENTEESVVEATEDFVPTESMLFAIYKITDQYVPGGYYVFIGHKGILSFDHRGVYTTDGEPMPDSFVDYEKETIRYSPKFGWGQNYEPMGFLYDGLAYAGHQDINETFDYITENFGSEYKHRYVSQELAEIID